MVELQRTVGDASHAATDVAGYRLRSCVHAHGELASNAICGVDNASQIHSSELAEDDAVLETVVKGATQEMLGSLDDQNARALIDAAEVRRLINEQKEKLIGAAGLLDFEGKKELLKRIFVLPSGTIFKMPETLVVDQAE
jgi:hypothetical protein